MCVSMCVCLSVFMCVCNRYNTTLFCNVIDQATAIKAARTRKLNSKYSRDSRAVTVPPDGCVFIENKDGEEDPASIYHLAQAVTRVSPGRFSFDVNVRWVNRKWPNQTVSSRHVAENLLDSITENEVIEPYSTRIS